METPTPTINFIRTTAPDRRFTCKFDPERPMIAEHLGLITIGSYITWGDSEFGFLDAIDMAKNLSGFKLVKATSLGINDEKELVQTTVRFTLHWTEITKTVLVDYIHEVTPRTQYYFKRVCTTIGSVTTVYNIAASSARDKYDFLFSLFFSFAIHC